MDVSKIVVEENVYGELLEKISNERKERLRQDEEVTVDVEALGRMCKGYGAANLGALIGLATEELQSRGTAAATS